MDALLEGWSCSCSEGGDPAGAREATCCQFAVTGREPHPTPVELEEVRHGMKAAGIGVGDRRRLPMAEGGACPLLAPDGRCRIYASRPFGCRTFFCRHATSDSGARLPRDAVNAIGRRFAALSARLDPRDPHPRPLVRALASLARDGRDGSG